MHTNGRTPRPDRGLVRREYVEAPPGLDEPTIADLAARHGYRENGLQAAAAKEGRAGNGPAAVDGPLAFQCGDRPGPRRSAATALVRRRGVASSALAVASPGRAQTPRLTVIGAGAGVTCADWTAAGRSDPELEHWAFGFASAVAAGAQLRLGDDPLANLDADAIHAWLGDHCRSRPDDALSVALVRMVFAALR